MPVTDFGGIGEVAWRSSVGRHIAKDGVPWCSACQKAHPDPLPPFTFAEAAALQSRRPTFTEFMALAEQTIDAAFAE